MRGRAIRGPATIRDLRASDREAVADLYARAAGYVLMETGRPPDAATVEGFLADAPPGVDPATSLRLGAWEEGRLQGICAISFGYPDGRDAYIGLLLLAPEARGRGLAQAMMGEAAAGAARGAGRLLVAVLEGNARGRAFWTRVGFGEERRFPPAPGRTRPTSASA